MFSNEMSVRCQDKKAKAMKKFRIMCPECGAGFLVDFPEALVWERCPACRVHVWDMYDALMAEKNASVPAHAGNMPASN